MTPEIISLTVFCFTLSLYAAWSFGRQRMASKIAVVQQQNDNLLARIDLLETERANDRIVVKAVQDENYFLRRELETLRAQVKTLSDKYAAAEQRANEWQQTAHDWQQASRGK